MDFQLNLNTESVERVYSADPVCVDPHLTVREVLRRLQQLNRGCALICRDGVLVGIFTERDALRFMANGTSLDTPIEQVMVPRPVTLATRDTVGRAIAKMSFGGYRHLPIVDDQGQPLGVLKASEILSYLVEHFPNVVRTLPPAPHHSTQQREGA